jgi:hypothetical protein
MAAVWFKMSCYQKYFHMEMSQDEDVAPPYTTVLAAAVSCNSTSSAITAAILCPPWVESLIGNEVE